MSGFRRATGQTIDLSAAARPGSGNLHFIGIDSKGNVYSAEVQGKRVQKFRNLGGL